MMDCLIVTDCGLNAENTAPLLITLAIKQLYKQSLNAPMNNSFDILASTPNRQ